MEIVHLLTLSALFLLFLFNYLRYGDILYPPVLQGGMWIVITTLFILNEDMFLTISILTYVVIVIGVTTFTIGSYVSTWNYKFRIKSLDISQTKINNRIVRFLFYVSIGGLPFFCHKAYTLGTTGPYNNFFINLRAALTGEDRGDGYGILAYLVTASFLSAWLELFIYFKTHNKFRMLASYLVAILYALLSTGRTFPMLLFVTTFGILLVTRRLSFVKTFFYFGSLGLMIFIGVGVLLNKGASISDDPLDIFIKMYDTFKIYLLGALPAFDNLLQQNLNAEFGLNTFKTFFTFIRKFDKNISVLPLTQNIVFVPMPTNVYTVYQPYYRDFLLFGVIGIQFFLGIWHGFLYKKATMGKAYYVFLYALFLYPLFMQFFEDQYMSLLSMWVQYLSIIFIIFHSFNLSYAAVKSHALS